MKNTDKITLTIGQLKRLIKEAKETPIEKLGWVILNEINEASFEHSMRYKSVNVVDVDEEKKSATLFWMTQEGFDGYDFNQFMKEVRRAAKEVVSRRKFKINDLVTFKVEAVGRDGRWAGYNTRKFTIEVN